MTRLTCLSLAVPLLLAACNDHDADFSQASRDVRVDALHAAIGTDARAALDAVESYMALYATDGCIDGAAAGGGVTTIDCPEHGAGRVVRTASLSVVDYAFEGWQPFLSSPVLDGTIQREELSDGRTRFRVDLVADVAESHLEVTCTPLERCRTEGAATVRGRHPILDDLGSFEVRSEVSALDPSAARGVIKLIGEDTLRTDLETDLRPDGACTKITIDGERSGSICPWPERI